MSGDGRNTGDGRRGTRITRFQRVNLILALATLAVMACLSMGRAQTMAEAAWANVSLAVQLCAQESRDTVAWTDLFRQAGFAETVEAAANGDTTHTFAAPAGTATVTLYYGQMPSDCRVESAHLGVTLASQLLDALAPTLVPGYRRIEAQGAVDPATGRPAQCVRYEQPDTPIPHVLAVSAGGGADACVENGTSVISNYSAV